MIPFLHRLSEPAAEENPLWLIVLADMMTNLMLFFLVMYALKVQGLKAQQSLAGTFDSPNLIAAPPQAAAAAARPGFLERQAVGELKRLFADTATNERTIRVRLRDQLPFASSQALLFPKADGTLSQLAHVLREMPNTIIVEGHTDDVPLTNSPYKSNWELSVARSNSVIEKLVRDGIAPERLVAAGYGEHRPIASNETAEGRARNRRVEIVILKESESRGE